MAGELPHENSPIGSKNAKVRLGAVAGRQWGRVTAAQILALGASRKTIAGWKRQGYIHRVHPRVYAVGHRAPSYEADLAAALLYAGPGAALSHQTAAHWLGLLDDRPDAIHVRTPRRCRSRRGLVVHGDHALERIWHRRFPTTTIPQTLLDIAATEPRRRLRKALASADYRKWLDLPAIEATLGRGRRGTARLRDALAEHQPRLARTRSELEIAFLTLCESAGIPLPDVNERLAGWDIDAMFRAQRIAVELDGYDNHHTPAQLRRDRRKEMAIRKAGFVPVRYSPEQVFEQPQEVAADVLRLLAA